MLKPSTGLARDEWRALKTAVRELVHDVGGLEAASAACRLQRSSLARNYSPQHPELLPVDVVAELERASGTMPVTTALARLGRHALVPLHADPGEPELLRQLGELMRHVGQACTSGAEAMSDGLLEAHEIEALKRDLHRVGSACSSLMAWLDRAARPDGMVEE